MLRLDNLKYYTREIIAALKYELEQTLPTQIREKEKLLTEIENEIGQQRAKIEKYTQENINPLRLVKDDLIARRREIILPTEIARELAEKESLQSRLSQVADRLSSENDALQLMQRRRDALESRLAEVNRQLISSPFQVAINNLRANLNGYERVLQIANAEHRELDAKICRKEGELNSLQTISVVDTAYHVTDHHGGWGGHHSSHHGGWGHHHHHGGLGHAVNDALRESSISALQCELPRLRGAREHVCRRVSAIECDIRSARASLLANETSLRQSQMYIESQQLQGSRNIEQSNFDSQASRVRRTAEEQSSLARQCQTYDDGLSAKNQDLEQARQRVSVSADTSLATKDLSTVSRELIEVNGLLDTRALLQGDMQRSLNVESAKLETERASLSVFLNRQSTLQSDVFFNQYEQLQRPDLQQDNLLQALNQSLDLAFTHFEMLHPVKQGLAVRLALHDLPRHKAFFYQAQNIPAQERYWMLTGLVHDAISKLSPNDVVFKETLLQVLNGHLLDPVQAVTAYRGLKNINQQYMQDTSEQSLRSDEAAQYYQAVQGFEAQLKQMPSSAMPYQTSMYQHGRELLKAITSLEKREAHSLSVTYDECFDIKFHTKVLNASTQLLHEPWRADLQQRVADLAEHNPYGKGSVARRRAGILTMFLGAAMVVGALIMGVVSIGLTSPLALAGVVLGGAAFIGGLGVFLSGCQRGVDKSLQGLLTNSMFSSGLQQSVYGHQVYEAKPLASAPTYGT